MKKIYTIYFVILLFVFSLSVGFFTHSLISTPETNTTPNQETEPEEEQSVTSKDETLELLNSLSLDEKIGQMLIISYRTNDTLDSKLTNILTTVKPGGFILFKENLKDYEKAQSFIYDIKNTSTIPMFISIDEEGGRVDRFASMQNYTYTKIPPMLEIGNGNDENLAYQTGENIATILQEFNINMDFAPVADVFSNPDNTVIGNRSFGSNPYLVARMSSALAKGLSDNKIIPVYKHFPGHGNTVTDSHVDLPVVTKNKEELLKSDLIPFVNAINNNAELIMIGHLAIPNITNDFTPASLSKTLITDILKNELGYQNLVITDALNMKALTKYYSEKETYELAINAGVDILLMPNDPIKAIEDIKASINEGTISMDSINNSVLKILSLKKKYNLT